MSENLIDMSIRLDTASALDGQTEGRTDKQKCRNNIALHALHADAR